MNERNRLSEDPREPADKLKRVDELTKKEVNPLVSEFGKFLADRIGDRDIDPKGFVLASSLAIYDLQKGVDGFTHETIKNELTQRSPEVYEILRDSLPHLASIAFTKDFSVEVNEIWQTMEDDINREKKEALKAFLENQDTDIINFPIRSIDEAKEYIIEEAKKRVVNLDWNHFSVKKDEVEKCMESVMPLILRNSNMGFSLNMLNVSTPKEKEILDLLGADLKSQIVSNYWLVMLGVRIKPEEATFIRDWLFLKGPEAVAIFKELDIEEVMKFTLKDLSVLRAANRVNKYLEDKESNL